MIKYLFVTFMGSAVLADVSREPVYQYRYKTEDVMQSDASSIPIHGYHFSEGGYYPQHYNFYPGRFGETGYEGYSGSGVSRDGYYPTFHHNTGGGYLDRSSFNGGKKNTENGGYQHASGKKGEEFTHSQDGYKQGQVDLKNNKGDSGYYAEVGGKKNLQEDGKAYAGDQHYNHQGKSGAEKNEKGFHKKGHVIKGFKKSHHKDEDEKTEEFYDEKHDEGGKSNFGGQSGSFGEQAQSTYKGGQDDGHFNAAHNKKSSQYDSHHNIDNSNGGQNLYGGKKFSHGGESYGSNSGIDQHSILGHQEANKIFKHQPYHVPFFPNE